MIDISQYKTIFWDFDGVIKESVEIKSNAFVQIFKNYGKNFTDRVLEHHLCNGGMSRFKKFAIYLEWAGLDNNEQQILAFSHVFSRKVVQEVIESEWVPGVEKILRTNPYQQRFVLISATPVEELMKITRKIKIDRCFDEIYGAPVNKSEAVHMSLISRGEKPQDCLMIGDSQEDMSAAKENHVVFLLRRYTVNNKIFSKYTGEVIEDFKKC